MDSRAHSTPTRLCPLHAAGSGSLKEEAKGQTEQAQSTACRKARFPNCGSFKSHGWQRACNSGPWTAASLQLWAALGPLGQ
eukprot:scaffold55286_cov17-Tisochrysis_lutea.AAC.1